MSRHLPYPLALGYIFCKSFRNGWFDEMFLSCVPLCQISHGELVHHADVESTGTSCPRCKSDFSRGFIVSDTSRPSHASAHLLDIKSRELNYEQAWDPKVAAMISPGLLVRLG